MSKKSSLGIPGTFLRFVFGKAMAFFRNLEKHPIEGIAFTLLNVALAFFLDSFSKLVSLELALLYLAGVLIYHAIIPVLRPIWERKQKSILMEYFSAVTFVVLMLFYAYLIIYLIVFDLIFLILGVQSLITGLF
jgi:hypothetical protein